MSYSLPQKISLTIVTLALFIIFIPHAYAASSLCPAGYNDQQCYAYLQQKQNELNAKKQALDKSLSSLKYQEGDLQAQVNAIEKEIEAKEIEVNEKQVEMEMTSIEIREIGAQITETQTKIDTMKQEIQDSSNQIKDTVLLSYKMSTIPTWYLLASNDLITTIEMMRYMDYVVKEEKSKLNQLNQLQTQLASEEMSLSNDQNEIIAKRDVLEATNLELIKLKNDLEADSATKTKLLADLKAMEAKVKADQAKVTAESNQYASEALSIAIRLLNEGRLGKGAKVNKGDVIAFQGHTGCSYGSHLHFGIIKGKNYTSVRANVNPFSAGYLRGGTSYGSAISSGSGQAPLNGAMVTQGFHEGYALDMVSLSEGNQSGQRYFIPKGSLKCNPSYQGYHGLRGEGAAVRAMLSGTIYKGNTDRWGSNYIIIDHGNDLLTFYFHLR